METPTYLQKCVSIPTLPKVIEVSLMVGNAAATFPPDLVMMSPETIQNPWTCWKSHEIPISCQWHMACDLRKSPMASGKLPPWHCKFESSVACLRSGGWVNVKRLLRLLRMILIINKRKVLSIRIYIYICIYSCMYTYVCIHVRLCLTSMYNIYI